jgi:hypothetical protein
LQYDVGTLSSTFGAGLIANSKRVEKLGTGTLQFNGAKFSAVDTGTLLTTAGVVRMDVSSGNAGTWGGAIGFGTSGTLDGTLLKTGAGSFTAKHFRVGTLNVDGGTLRVLNEGTGPTGASSLTTNTTNHVNVLTLAGGDSPSVKLDLANNELIVDYSGATPIGTLSSGTQGSGIARQVQTAYAAGSWSGNGITSNWAEQYAADLDYAIGYAEASEVLGSGGGTFAGQSVDGSSVLIRFTRYGDANVDGITNIADFSRLSANFNLPGIWHHGDSNYDGFVNISDYSRMVSQFNEQQLYRGVRRLQELYIAMLESPQIYWESRSWTAFWEANFAEFEGLGLGPIPPVPANLLARGIPEPTLATMLAPLAAMMLAMRRSARGGQRAAGSRTATQLA